MKKTITLILCFFLLSVTQSNAQCLIKGQVTDDHKESVVSATVMILNTEIGTTTDLDGDFILQTNCGDSVTLAVTYIGYERVEKRIFVEKNTVVNFVLKEGITTDEVVVVGYGTTRKDSPPPSSAPSRSRESEYKSSMSDFAAISEAKGGDADYIKKEYKSGLLTAGEVNDFSKWELWQDITKNELSTFQSVWNMTLMNRYTVQVMNQNGVPVIDAAVHLLDKNEIIWQAKTDNTGKAELWANVFDEKENSLSATVIYDGEKHDLKKVTSFHEGINTIKIKAKCDIPNQVDVLFVVDATYSMADEINYLQAELNDVITKMQAIDKDAKINLGSVFYRDKGDEYLTRQSDFSDNFNQTLEFIKNQSADGGGDHPEAVEEALEIAINQMTWSEKAKTRLLFLVLDAPPHEDKAVLEKLEALTLKAAEKGIRIIPIAASGIDKSTEYLMRCLALSTNGTYTFLTDDSGIGNSHIKPTTDSYDVELLNDLLVRLFKQYTQSPSCEAEENEAFVNETLMEITDTTTAEVIANTTESVTDTIQTETEPIAILTVNCYPNPTQGQLTIDISADIDELFITDFSGKIVQRHLKLKAGKNDIDLGNFASGVYFVRYLDGKKSGTKKIVLVH